MLQTIIAGDTLTFTTTIADYPASEGWTLTHVLRPLSSGDAIQFAATASGDDYVTTVAATTTNGWEAGEYSLVAHVSKAGERYTLDAVALADGSLTNNIITVRANPADGDPYDSRSHARKTLDALEAMIEGRASQAQQRYTIRDREVLMLGPEELIKWRSYYRAEVAREEAAGSGRSRNSYLRFARA